MQNLGTFGWVVIATGEVLGHGVRNGQPRRGWDRSAWEDVSAAKGEKTPPEYIGKGLWEEWEHDADIDPETHKLSDPEWVVDSENKRLVRTRTAVALTQGEIDARAAAAAQQRVSRAAVLLQTVIDGAETARLQFITGGAGKALTYEAKRKEAVDYTTAAAASDPDLPTINATLYPFAHAEAVARNGTPSPSAAQVATVLELYASLAGAWVVIGATIEAKYQKAVIDIEAARDAADDAAMEAAAVVVWPAP